MASPPPPSPPLPRASPVKPEPRRNLIDQNIIHRRSYRPRNIRTHERHHDDTHRGGANDHGYCLGCQQALRAVGRLCDVETARRMTPDQRSVHGEMLANPTARMVRAWIALMKDAKDREAAAWLDGYVGKLDSHFHRWADGGADKRAVLLPAEKVLAARGVEGLVEAWDGIFPESKSGPLKEWFELWAELMDDGKPLAELENERVLQYSWVVFKQHRKDPPDGNRGIFTSEESIVLVQRAGSATEEERSPLEMDLTEVAVARVLGLIRRAQRATTELIDAIGIGQVEATEEQQPGATENDQVETAEQE